MSQFKTGDVVECIKNSWGGYPGSVGDCLTVLEVMGARDGYGLTFKEFPDDRGCAPERFRLREPAISPARPVPERPDPEEWLKQRYLALFSGDNSEVRTAQLALIADMLSQCFGVNVDYRIEPQFITANESN